MYDYIIVGAGLFGATFAQQAKEHGKKCLILEKRNHIAGNCYTEKINDIDIHRYGPHIFHTNSDIIWSYVNRFAIFNNFINRPKVNFDNKIFSFPINLLTLNQLWGVTTPDQAKTKLDSVIIKNDNPKNLEEWILSQVGEEIYKKFIYGYTKKQWGTEPKNLPSFIIKRLPIRLDFNDNYFFDKYQGIPINGYTDMISNMINDIDIDLGIDFFDNIDKYEKLTKHIIYTGPIDKFFNYQHGKLEYRSLEFETTEFKVDDYQGNAIINYTHINTPYTRIVEHKHFNRTPENTKKVTYITKEYPVSEISNNHELFYPINNTINQKIFDKYKNLCSSISNKYIFGGRLAEYRYYDMHQVIGSALAKFKNSI